MLLQIHNLIKREKIVSIQQLARQFHMAENVLDPMLALLTKKGMIKCFQKTTCKTFCGKCSTLKQIKYYQFLE